MKTLHKIRKNIDTALSSVCIFLFAVMVVVGTYQIVTRFVFNRPSTISEELLTYTFAWMAMLASSYVFGKRDHMKMSFLVDKLPAESRKKKNSGYCNRRTAGSFCGSSSYLRWFYNHEPDNDTKDRFSWNIHGNRICGYAAQRNSDYFLRNFKHCRSVHRKLYGTE